MLGAVSAFDYQRVRADGDDFQITVTLTDEFPSGGEFWLVYPKVNGESMIVDADNTSIDILTGDIMLAANILRID